MIAKKIEIKIFAPPAGKCPADKSWENAAEMVALNLDKKFKDLVDVKFIELFTPESFGYTKINKLLNDENHKPPYIMLNDKIIQIGGKLSERIIKEKIEEFIKRNNEI